MERADFTLFGMPVVFDDRIPAETIYFGDFGLRWTETEELIKSGELVPTEDDWWEPKPEEPEPVEG